MRVLQYNWAAEQTVLFPPLLHAMIYALKYMRHHSGEGKTDLIPATTRLRPGGIGGRDN
jgi:hypothetical protein